jgi:hypothetical protein
MLMHTLLMGLVVFFTIEIVRKLPVIKTAALAGTKPWGCDQCMSFWIGAMWNGAVVLWLPDLGRTWTEFVLDWPATSGVSLALILWTSSLTPSEPPELP